LIEWRESIAIYIIGVGSGVKATWLASPISSTSPYCLLFAQGAGGVDNPICDGEYLGIRPVVCLSSNVQLEDAGDGIYVIK
jgi:hypothetical protein